MTSSPRLDPLRRNLHLIFEAFWHAPENAEVMKLARRDASTSVAAKEHKFTAPVASIPSDSSMFAAPGAPGGKDSNSRKCGENSFKSPLLSHVQEASKML